jgi:N-acetylated-alpha-linked acidic dipeptidase
MARHHRAALLLCLLAVAAASRRTEAGSAGPAAAPGPAAPGPAEGGGAPPSGFAASRAGAQAAAEAAALASVDPASCRALLRAVAASPRVAGTPGADAARALVASRFREWGYRVEEPAYEVLLSYPERVLVEALPGGAVAPVALLDSAHPRGPEQFGEGGLPFPSNAWSGSGRVEGPLVDGGWGTGPELDAVVAAGVPVRGAVVLVRYGRIFRGLKVREAQARGAAAVLLYSDPADDGEGKGPVFPEGPWRPGDSVQRGSLQDISAYPGDPLTPGVPSIPGRPRKERREVSILPSIPCAPLSADEARRLLALVGGLPAEPPPLGALRHAPGAASRPGAAARVEVRMREETRTIRNVIATWPGSELPDRRVILGSHRDSWCAGAVDAASGTAALLEAARAVAAAARAGHPPRRTVQFCSWDGEEFGLVGSVEWCEQHAEALSREAVAYLNADPGVSGPDLALAGSPALFPLLREAARALPDSRVPGSSLWDGFLARVAADPGNSGRECPCGVLGSGSDYTPFLDHLGIPAADLQFSGPYGVYHSVHDGVAWMERHGDPAYLRHADLARLLALAALRLANADLPHLSYAAAGDEIVRHAEALEARHPGAWPTAEGARRDGVGAAASLLRAAGIQLDRRRDAALRGGEPAGAGALREAEVALAAAERALLDPEGLPGRPWYRHLVYAPGTATGYAPDPLPGLAEALRGGGRGVADAESRLRRALDRCRERVEAAAAALPGAPR